MSNEISAVSSQVQAAIQPEVTTTKPVQVSTAKVRDAEPVTGSTTASQGVDATLVAQVIDQLNTLASEQQRNLKFSVDEPTGRTVVRVYSSASDELIRQIPGEEVLELAKRFAAGDTGALMNIVA